MSKYRENKYNHTMKEETIIYTCTYIHTYIHTYRIHTHTHIYTYMDTDRSDKANSFFAIVLQTLVNTIRAKFPRLLKKII